MNTVKAEITDLFSSIQGEGVFVGAKQIFARFRQCNLACVYCDEPWGNFSPERNPARPAKRDWVRDEPWKREPRALSALELLTEIRFLDQQRGPHHSVSLTGGEPLMYTDFLKVFLKLLRKEKRKVYLETNGTMPEALGEVIDLVDIVAMDFKLPSSTGQRAYWDEHFDFLKIAAKKNAFVKVVVTPQTTKEDIERSIDILKRLKKDIPFIIQPATPLVSGEKPVESGRLLEFLEIGARNAVDGIRVIPQVHKMLGVK